MRNDPVTILSIDDETDIHYALKAIFDFAGWNSIFASNVHEGLQLFVEKKPDIVLIDYHMPVVNGIKGVEMIRDLSASVPIIVFTIDESQNVANDFLAAGATDFALKPIKAPDLISRINLHIKLLERLKPTEPASELPKGISQNTLDIILGVLKSEGKLMGIAHIAQGTGFAPQTINRYLQYMLEAGIVVMQIDYGKKGRPRQQYCCSI